MGAKSATTVAVSESNGRLSCMQTKLAAKAGRSVNDKVVRDSFTMPAKAYAKIAKLKGACPKAGFQIKKCELLRIGSPLISNTGMERLKSAQAKLDLMKTGRATEKTEVGKNKKYCCIAGQGFLIDAIKRSNECKDFI